MADILQALCWGLICGFEVLLPYWYVCFFVPMIIHRAVRDDARCAMPRRDRDTYIKRVPACLSCRASSRSPPSVVSRAIPPCSGYGVDRGFACQCLTAASYPRFC